MMTDDELDELAADIKANGLRQPVVVWAPHGNARRDQQLLLDGRNRLDAMERAGLPVLIWRKDTYGNRVAFFDRDIVRTLWGTVRGKPSVDPYAFAISANVHRRHLTAAQRRELIAAVLKADPSRSNRQIGRVVKVDDKTVAAVRTKLTATAEIPQLPRTVGRDGKARPARKAPQAPAKPKDNFADALGAAINGFIDHAAAAMDSPAEPEAAGASTAGGMVWEPYDIHLQGEWRAIGDGRRRVYAAIGRKRVNLRAWRHDIGRVATKKMTPTEWATVKPVRCAPLTIGAADLADRLKPIVENLQEQSERAPGTIPNRTIATLAAQIRKLLRELHAPGEWLI